MLLILHFDGRDYFMDFSPGLVFSLNIIPLDFKTESPECISSVYKLKFERVERDGQELIAAKMFLTENNKFSGWRWTADENDWMEYLLFVHKYLALDELFEKMNDAYKNPTIARGLINIMVYRLPGGKLRMMRMNKFYLENEDRRRMVTNYETKEEVTKTILEHFGDVFDAELISKAYEAVQILNRRDVSVN